MYCNEPKGTVRSATEYVSAEEEDSPRQLLLNFVSTPVYTGTPLFLGATEARRSARIAIRRVLASGESSDTLNAPTARGRKPSRTKDGKNLPSKQTPSRRRTRTRSRPASIDQDIMSHSRSTPTPNSEVQVPDVEMEPGDSARAPPEPPMAKVKRVILKLGKPSTYLEGGSITKDLPNAPDQPDKEAANLSENPPADQRTHLTTANNESELDSAVSMDKEQTACSTTSVNKDPQRPVISGTRNNEPSNSDANSLIARDLLETPQLTEIISLGDPSVDIHEKLTGRYKEDPFFQKILQNPAAFKNFEVSND
ncbi:hypothetical protein P692DRAFT_20714554, partial [Suillus brevipes Sb2]